MQQEQILPHQFMFQPREIRELLAAMFGVGKSGITEVRDQTVVSDGRTVDDLKEISLEKMRAYVGDPEATLGIAWEKTVMKAAAELEQLNAPAVLAAPAPTTEELNAGAAAANEARAAEEAAAAKAAEDARLEEEAVAAAEAQAKADEEAAAKAEEEARAQADAAAAAEATANAQGEAEAAAEEELPPLPGSNE